MNDPLPGFRPSHAGPVQATAGIQWMPWNRKPLSGKGGKAKGGRGGGRGRKK